MSVIFPLLLVQIAIVASYFAFRRRAPRSKIGSTAHLIEGPYRRRR